MRWRPILWTVVALAAIVCVGLAGQGLLASRGGTQPDRPLVVSAASSLQDVFERLAREFERAHPGARITLNLGGSQRLRTQIEQGAPADVFASANRRYVEALRRQGLVQSGVTFAENELVIVVPTENPASIRSLRDLPQAERIVLGTSDVPVGRYSEEVLHNAAARYGASFLEEVKGRVASRELNVRQVLAKVTLGEADAGIVYRTDAQSAKERVQAIAVPDDFNVSAQYVMAVVAGTPVPELARAWVDFVRSPSGQSVLAAYGFIPVKGTSL